MNQSSYVFEIIDKTLKNSNNRLSVSSLCKIAGVSRSGFYAWIKAKAVRQAQEEQDRRDFELILSARFNDLERELQITHATLSSQLKYLEKEGLVSRTVYAEVPLRVEYALTLMGKRFAPVLGSIQVWGEEYIEFLKANRS